MRVEIIPCLQDNYAYLIVAPSGAAAIVDPSEAEPVLDAVKRSGVRLEAVWNTHHHWDHIGGNEEIAQAFPGIAVYGHSSDQGRIPAQTHGLDEGDEVSLGSLRARVLHNPGHTLGAISYVIEGAAFTGDTLFAGGCGRIFEGDPPMMYRSLRKLGDLPGGTLVYPGHEYTAKNLEFSASVEPDNEAVRRRLGEVDEKRRAGVPSVPGTVDDERQTNPFLRAHLPGLMAAMEASSPVDSFAALRRAKDSF